MKADKRGKKSFYNREHPVCIETLVMLYGGLRVSEVCNLNREDVDFEEFTITVKNTKNRVGILSDRFRVSELRAVHVIQFLSVIFLEVNIPQGAFQTPGVPIALSLRLLKLLLESWLWLEYV